MKSGAETINPYDNRREKSVQVEEMFDSIAPAYDFMNSAMSFGLHRNWRTRALNAAGNALGTTAPKRILDVATGTGDVAFDLHRRYPEAKITGVDLSEGMLEIAREKLKKLDKSEENIIFMQGDSLDLKFGDNTFDLVTVAYGVRNFENLAKGLRELYRVLNPGGTICIIELSEPSSKTTRWLYRLYARTLIPAAGRLISGDSRAYSYLPESIAAAPQRDNLTAIMREAGFDACEWKSMTMGTATYYIGHKNASEHAADESKRL